MSIALVTISAAGVFVLTPWRVIELTGSVGNQPTITGNVGAYSVTGSQATTITVTGG